MLTLTPEQRSNKVTLTDWLISYRDSESRKKRGAKQEVLRINRFLQRPFAALKIGQITYKDLQKYFDERLKEPSQKYIGTLAPATAHKEIQTLSAAFNLAVKSGLISKNPCIGVVLPKPAEHRERTASDEDIEALLVASGWEVCAFRQAAADDGSLLAGLQNWDALGGDSAHRRGVDRWGGDPSAA